MAMRSAARYVSRRFSTSGKILSEEEKAAENIYIKKMEKEKLEKLHKQGTKAEETSASSGGSATDAAKATTTTSSSTGGGGGASTEKVSTDKNRNYAVVAGVVTGLAALGWYLKASKKKPEEVQD